jgi:hypothetical protein
VTFLRAGFLFRATVFFLVTRFLGLGLAFGLSFAAHSMHSLPRGFDPRAVQPLFVLTLRGTREQPVFVW